MPRREALSVEMDDGADGVVVAHQAEGHSRFSTPWVRSTKGA